jgi:hypothetical protein
MLETNEEERKAAKSFYQGAIIEKSSSESAVKTVNAPNPKEPSDDDDSTIFVWSESDKYESDCPELIPVAKPASDNDIPANQLALDVGEDSQPEEKIESVSEDDDEEDWKDVRSPLMMRLKRSANLKRKKATASKANFAKFKRMKASLGKDDLPKPMPLSARLMNPPPPPPDFCKHGKATSPLARWSHGKTELKKASDYLLPITKTEVYPPGHWLYRVVVFTSTLTGLVVRKEHHYSFYGKWIVLEAVDFHL